MLVGLRFWLVYFSVISISLDQGNARRITEKTHRRYRLNSIRAIDNDRPIIGEIYYFRNNDAFNQ